ncbi:hypothetical protein [Mycobacterium avium]|uniref:Uncharacterized protein n=1 Tax=Mycobacterium avium subsp. hominissuis TaxID=439334 RepID=A0AAI8ST39_MYCAV|nr:hypothetical protein [Mycobacterium avium]PBA08602.1 hypothetical protein CKJ70_25525 [Mycobacterium avium]BBN50902.1 hypothetical protein JPH1_53770 [Mycobacterium avium subsp. hominissuis]
MSTQDADELIACVVNAYLDYLEGGGLRPELGDLPDDVRVAAVAVINIVLAGAGSNIYSDVPTFQELLAGTEFDDNV